MLEIHILCKTPKFMFTLDWNPMVCSGWLKHSQIITFFSVSGPVRNVNFATLKDPLNESEWFLISFIRKNDEEEYEICLPLQLVIFLVSICIRFIESVM